MNVLNHGLEVLIRLVKSFDDFMNIVACQGIEALVGALNAHPKSAKIRLNWLLSRIALDGVSRATIAACGGIDDVVVTLNLHRDDVSVLRNALALFSAMADDDEYLSVIAEGGGITAVLAVLNEHPADAILQSCGCEALSNLAFDED